MKKNFFKLLAWASVGLLWMAAIAAVLLIGFWSGATGFTQNDIANTHATTSNGQELPATVFTADAGQENEWVFYDKKAFIRRFSNEFSVALLSAAYDNAAANNRPIRVVQRHTASANVTSFDDRFVIKPLPANK